MFSQVFSRLDYEFNLAWAKKFWYLKLNAVQYTDHITLLSDKTENKLALASTEKVFFQNEFNLTIKIDFTNFPSTPRSRFTLSFSKKRNYFKNYDNSTKIDRII